MDYQKGYDDYIKDKKILTKNSSNHTKKRTKRKSVNKKNKN